MTWIINEFDDYGGRLEATEVFVIVNKKGAAGLIFKRPPDKREHYIHGEDLIHFGLTAEYVLESVEEPHRKTEGIYELPSELEKPLLYHAKQIDALFEQERS